MIVETRKTPQGTEYWDAKEQRVRFVPTGNTAPFEITVDPASMIMGVDLATGTDMTVNNNIRNAKVAISPELIEDLTVKKLRALAKEADIEIPDNITKREDIIDFLKNELASDDE